MMLESMLQKPNNANNAPSPPETALALISFFQNEYPLGGAVETRFLRLFPLLCDRIFGPLLLQSLHSSNTNSSTSNINYSVEELELVQSAWLFQKLPWRNLTLNTRSSSSAATNERISRSGSGRTSLSTSSSSSSSTIKRISANTSGNKNNSHRNTSISSSSSTTTTSLYSTYSSRGLDYDPVIQLLSPPTPPPPLSSTSNYNNNSNVSINNTNSDYTNKLNSFLQIIESTSITSRQLKNVRLPFPFVELSPNLQQSLIQHILGTTTTTTATTTTTTSTSNNMNRNHTPTSSCSNVNADTTWKLLHYPIHEQNNLMITVKNYLQQQQQSLLFNVGYPPSSSSSSQQQQASLLQDTFDHNIFHHQHQYQHHQSSILVNTSTASTSAGANNNNTNNAIIQLSDIKVTLDLWEYYMILFLHHGIYSTKMKNILTKQFPNNNSSQYSYNHHHQHQQQPFGERVYLYLFKKYCEYYIPHDFYSTTTRMVPKQQQEQQEKYQMENELLLNHEQKSELFVRFIIEYYFEFHHVYPTTKQSLDNYLVMNHYNKNNNEGGGARVIAGGGNGLDCSFDFATLLPIPTTAPTSSSIIPSVTASATNTTNTDTMPTSVPSWVAYATEMIGSNNKVIYKKQQTYNAPSKQLQRNIRAVIEHILCDPVIKQKCYDKDYNKKTTTATNTTKKNMTFVVSSWPLSRSQTLLQPSFYNYIRTSLRYGAVHVRNSSFYTALDAWLTWLEPWNVVIRKKSRTSSSIENARDLFSNVSSRVNVNAATSSSSQTKPKTHQQQYYTTFEKPKVTANSKYTKAWETYIASNLHLYIVPLAIFLKRSREFDFSKDIFQSSMLHVQRVFRVFSPNVVATIEKLLKSDLVAGDESNSRSVDHSLFSIVQRHEQILGKFCPPRPTNVQDNDKRVWSLDMLQQDMHALLEEIALQHRKTIGEQDFIDRLGSRIQSMLFNEGLQAEERTIRNLIQKAKLIVNFPSNYEIFPNGKGGSDDMSSWNVYSHFTNTVFSPEREQNGCISDKGRAQLLEGSKICSAMDVGFVGDPMYARVKDHEVEALVKISILASEWLNEYFGFVKTSSRHLHGDDDIDLTNLLQEQDEAKNLKYRINLRFIASTRNWVFMVVLAKVTLWLFK